MAATASTESTVKKEPGKSKAWELTQEHIDFFSSSGDFSLVCQDGKVSVTFKVHQEELQRSSGFFRDMFSATKTEEPGGKSIQLSEDASPVALLLYAGLHPEHAALKSCNVWCYLSSALSLAIKWAMPEARQILLWSMMALAAEPERGMFRFKSLNMVPFFAEAALRGSASLSLAKQLWRIRYAQTPTTEVLTPIDIPPHIMLELSSSVCSSLMQAILDLVEERVFKKKV